MQPAQDRLATDLERLHFYEPEVPVIANVDAAPVKTPEAAREALVRQVTGAVQWEKSMRVLLAHQMSSFVEVGPGKVLSGLMRQIERAAVCLNVEDEATLQAAQNHFSQAKSHAS